MMFSSRAAEHDRISSLIFGTPEDVSPPSNKVETAPPTSTAPPLPEHEVQRILSLVGIKDDSFGVDTSSKADVYSPPTLHRDSASKATRPIPRRAYRPFRTDSSHIALPAMLFAGSTGMPMLSTLANGVLVNRIPHGMTDDGKNVTVAVALPANAAGEKKIRSAKQSKCPEAEILSEPQDQLKAPWIMLQPAENEHGEDGNSSDEEGVDTISAPINVSVQNKKGTATTFLAPPVIAFPRLQCADSEGFAGGASVSQPAARPALLKHRSFVGSKRRVSRPVELGRSAQSESALDRSRRVNVWEHSWLPTEASEENFLDAPASQQEQGVPAARKGLRETVVGKIRKLGQTKKRSAN